MDISDRVTVLDYGRLLAVGSPAEVRSHPAVIAAYLGLAHGTSAAAPTSREGAA